MSTIPLDLQDKKVVVYQENPIWEKTISLWCRHYGFGEIKSFTDKDKLENYCEDNHFQIDLIILDFYDKGESNRELIKALRKINEENLIIAISADFINDMSVLDTEEMAKALYAGANRVSIKEIKSLQLIIEQHLALRMHSDYDKIKTDPKSYFNIINTDKER
jgi:CheY-like chemotaxis protein